MPDRCFAGLWDGLPVRLSSLSYDGRACMQVPLIGESAKDLALSSPAQTLCRGHVEQRHGIAILVIML